MNDFDFKMNGESTEEQLYILWQPALKKGSSTSDEQTGVRILRVFGNQPCFSLPDFIEGMPVTEIGAYCFSMSEPKIQGESFWFPETPTDQGALSSLSGRFVEAITLPSSVTTLHNAAFYNCRQLQSLSVGAHIEAIGSDEFTNCSHLKQLILRCHADETTGLPLILGRIDTDLNVIFMSEHMNIWGTLFFPEYYEWLDEISPAHIFSRSIHGEGFRMRKCFQGNLLDYRKYDQCFENALTVESEKSLCHIALNRLRWPNHLEDSFRIIYENTVKKHLNLAIANAVKDKDLNLLIFLCTYFSFSPERYSQAISLCIDADWSEGAARLMEEKHRTDSAGSFAEKSFDFDDWT